MRHPGRSLSELVGDGPIYPLLILFGLNAVDELDRTGFGILLPNVRDAFGMSNTGILTLVGATALGALLMQMPIADRGGPGQPRRARPGRSGAVGGLLDDDRCGDSHLDAGHRPHRLGHRACRRRPHPQRAPVGPLPRGPDDRRCSRSTGRRTCSVSSSDRCSPVPSPTTSPGARRSSCSRCRRCCWSSWGCGCRTRCVAPRSGGPLAPTRRWPAPPRPPRASPSRGGCCGRSTCCGASGTRCRSSPWRSSGSSRSPGCSTRRSTASTSCSAATWPPWPSRSSSSASPSGRSSAPGCSCGTLR
jgi:hypothetical protein